MTVHSSSSRLLPCVWAGSDIVVLRAPEAEGREEQQALHQEEHDDRDDEDGRYRSAACRPCSVTTLPGSMPGGGAVARWVGRRCAWRRHPAESAARIASPINDERTGQRRESHRMTRKDSLVCVHGADKDRPMIRRDVPSVGSRGVAASIVAGVAAMAC